MKILLYALFLTLSPFTLYSQQQLPFPNIGMPVSSSAKGLLDLGDISNFGGEITLKTLKIPIYRSPTTSSKVILTLKSITQTEYKEMQTSAKSMPVAYDHQNEWYKIRTITGDGWIASKYVSQFIPLEKIVVTGCLMEEWNGFLYSKPSYTSTRFKPKWIRPGFPQECDLVGIKVIESKWIDGRLWLQVLISSIIPCSSDFKCLDKDLPGWIPAFTKSGLLVVWEYDC